MLGVVGKQLALVRMWRMRRSAPSGSHQADNAATGANENRILIN